MNIYTDHTNMSNAQLRHHFKQLERRKKLLAGIPIFLLLPSLLIYGFAGWVGTFSFMMGSDTSVISVIPDAIGFVLFAIGGVVLVTDSCELHKAMLLIFLAYDLLYLLFSGDLPIAGLCMLCYLAVAAYFEKRLNDEQGFMRNLPEYPFSDRQEAERHNDEYCQRLLHEQSDIQPRGEAYTKEKSDELLSTLPKRSIVITHETFEEPDEAYSGDIENKHRLRRHDAFEEPSSEYKGDLSSRDKLDEERVSLDELDDGYKGDFSSAKNTLDNDPIDFDELDEGYLGDFAKSE